MKLKHTLLPCLAIILVLFSCKDGIEIEQSYYPGDDYATIAEYLNLPAHALDYENAFPTYYRSTSAVFDKDMATLGRVLFYDKNLSEDRTISCESCHKQQIAFSDDVALSEGVQARRTSRNSLALGSVFSFREYYGSVTQGRIPFFWDNRASSVQAQSKETLKNANEMDMDMHQVLERVEDLPYYKPLFKAAYRDGEITDDRILDAIGEFVNSIGSFNSKYDQALDEYYSDRGNLSGIDDSDLNLFSEEENLGMQLYLANCASCHGRTAQAPGAVSANNGLAMSYEDKGMGGYTNNNSDNGIFKVPTLRNVALTGPYMHDGSFATLEEVIDHYSNGISNHPNLSTDLKIGNEARKMDFSATEKAALVAFLQAFTDESLMTAEKFSNPFK